MNIVTIPGMEYDSNIYLLLGKVPTIIDTGTGFHSKEIIEIIQKNIMITKIKQVVLTHEHYDHVGGVYDIISALQGNAKIYAHHEIVTKLKEGKSTFAEMLGGKMPKITVDVALNDGDHLTLGDQQYEILLTPGHSIGSLCLYEQNQKVLFSGDTVFANGGFGRYDFPGGDFTALLRSIQCLATLDVNSLYPGHGPIVERDGNNHVRQALDNIQSLI
ncbi:MAG: MBL fold metallo-hydrolase [Candidatus Thermoplasmatota archaeon]|nr:MBL fold metallo-hydrolase [Candidatus Thermoplasmatota archaeon]